MTLRTGFLGSMGRPTGRDFSGFASLQIQAMQAVRDAAQRYFDGTRNSRPADVHSHHTSMGLDPVLHAGQSKQHIL
jgi:hypothetical protein